VSRYVRNLKPCAPRNREQRLGSESEVVGVGEEAGLLGAESEAVVEVAEVRVGSESEAVDGGGGAACGSESKSVQAEERVLRNPSKVVPHDDECNVKRKRARRSYQLFAAHSLTPATRACSN
jgi:hypothetical protein